MTPRAWRKEKRLTLQEVAVMLGRPGAWSSVRRWEIGETEAAAGAVVAYERASRGDVTAADLYRVRKRWLAIHGEGTRAA